jgi:hypothetical protein
VSRRRWLALAIVTGWTLVALVAASQRHFFQAAVGRPIPFTTSLADALQSCWRPPSPRRSWAACAIASGGGG